MSNCFNLIGAGNPLDLSAIFCRRSRAFIASEAGSRRKVFWPPSTPSGRHTHAPRQAYGYTYYNMSVSSTSGAMLRRTIFSVRSAARPLGAAEQTARSSVFGSYRNVHRSARLPAITASEARHRPSLRPHQQSSRVTGLSPNSKRSIFIQTENTPNPDVNTNNFSLRLFH